MTEQERGLTARHDHLASFRVRTQEHRTCRKLFLDKVIQNWKLRLRAKGKIPRSLNFPLCFTPGRAGLAPVTTIAGEEGQMVACSVKQILGNLTAI